MSDARWQMADVRCEKKRAAARRGFRAASCQLLAASFLVLCSCGDEFTTTIVTAQVARTLAPASNTASVLAGTTTFQNIFADDWMATPDPGDSTFWSDPFPVKVTPIAGADVRVNSTTVGERVAGAYFRAALDLEFLARYDLAITTAEGREITGSAFLPDSFAIVVPAPGDSFGPGTVNATWTHSDSCETFIVGVTPADTASPAQGWADSRVDTFCVIPAESFQDTLGNFVPGDYVFSVTAVNGGWNKPALDLLLSGGNLAGALGTFGCAVLPAPVVFRVE